MPETLASLYVFFFLLGIVIAILWVMMPFAVFGIKKRIDTLIGIERRQLEHLRELSEIEMKREGKL